MSRSMRLIVTSSYIMNVLTLFCVALCSKWNSASYSAYIVWGVISTLKRNKDKSGLNPFKTRAFAAKAYETAQPYWCLRCEGVIHGVLPVCIMGKAI